MKSAIPTPSNALLGHYLQEAVEKTWAQVKQRDWRKDSQNGGEMSFGIDPAAGKDFSAQPILDREGKLLPDDILPRQYAFPLGECCDEEDEIHINQPPDSAIPQSE